MDTWATASTQESVEEVLKIANPLLDAADGVTVSGGEPFDQPEGLRELLKGIRSRTRADILVFSGYSQERLTPQLTALDGLIDCLIADPFDASAPQTLALRGSDNQRLICLTPLGQKRFATFDRPLLPTDRVLDILFDDETGVVFLAGIPRPGDMRKLASLLAEDSHVAVTTEGRVASQ